MSTALETIQPDQPALQVRTGALALDQNPAAVYLASLESEQSRRTMRLCLNKIAYLLGAPQREGISASKDTACFLIEWGALRFQHTTAVRTKLAAQFKLHHANKMLFALRGTLRNAWKLGQMSADDYTRAADLKPLKGETLLRGRALTAGEIAALLEACSADDSPAGARDGALIAVLIFGLRRAEVCALDLADYDQIAQALKVHGKGNKERLVQIEQGAADALGDWLAIRGRGPGPLFYPVSQIGEIERTRILEIVNDRGKKETQATPARLTPQAIYNALDKRAGKAGFEKHSFSPHDFRRTFVSDLLDAGADIATVQKLAGHSNVTTTARYDRRGEQAKRKAVNLLHVPYRRRSGHP